MIQVIQLVELAQLAELRGLLHGVLYRVRQLLVMRLMSGVGCLMRRGEGGHRERNEQHRAAEDVRTTSTHCARLLPTPFVDIFCCFVLNSSDSLERAIFGFTVFLFRLRFAQRLLYYICILKICNNFKALY